jgi:hypothetical protein
MPDNSQLTSYCGLYCKDCIPSKTELYAVAARLQGLLEELQFVKYAGLKAGQTYWAEANPAFKHYPEFLAVLQAIRDLECPSICREGGGYKGDRCEIKKCAIAKGFDGCWQCSDYQSCKLLEPMKSFHPHLEEHLALIKTEGMENWCKKRKGHYTWLAEKNVPGR